MKKTLIIFFVGFLFGLAIIVSARPAQRPVRQIKDAPVGTSTNFGKKFDELQRRGVVVPHRSGDLRAYEPVTRGEVLNMFANFEESILDTDDNALGYLIDLFCNRHARNDFPNGLKSKYDTICTGRQ